MKITEVPFYEVEIITNHSSFFKKKSVLKCFAENEVPIARKSAIDFMTSALSTNKDESENQRPFLKSILAPKQKNNPVSAIVYFVKNKVEKYQIFGQDIHETLYGLHEEANYYLKKGLIEEEGLTTILHNKDDEDIHNPIFFISKELTKLTTLDIQVVKILSDNLHILLPRNKFFSLKSEPQLV